MSKATQQQATEVIFLSPSLQNQVVHKEIWFQILERPMLQVKIENTTDFPIDNAFTTMNSRHSQMQFRQQQITAMSALQDQAGNQFRSLASLQVPQMQMQTQSLGMVRAPPVKVEGFSELMGGDASLKHDENKLTSPSK